VVPASRVGDFVPGPPLNEANLRPGAGGPAGFTDATSNAVGPDWLCASVEPAARKRIGSNILGNVIGATLRPIYQENRMSLSE
jgi:hypothetical protein